MRSNIVTEAGLPTRLALWWDNIPFLTSAIVVVCGVIYLICLLIGYDSFSEICFLPAAILSKFQVYRIFTAILFHGSFLHVFFNMLALVPLGSELERIMGSVRLLYLIVLFAITNAIFHLLIALVVAYNPFQTSQYLANECAVGFSGILFSMIVIETSLSGVQSRSVFGLFNIPAKWYPWLLLVAFQVLMTNVSLLGHLCGILSGYAYTYGLFNFLIPGTSFYSAIEASPLLSNLIRRPKFIMCTGGNPLGSIPTYAGQNTTASGLFSGNMWRNVSSWIPQRETYTESTQDSRFPGRGRSLASSTHPMVPALNSDSNLQARLLDDSNENHPSVGRHSALGNPVGAARGIPVEQQVPIITDEQIQQLMAMGFDKTQVDVAIAAADGDLNIAVEILMTQHQG